MSLKDFLKPTKRKIFAFMAAVIIYLATLLLLSTTRFANAFVIMRYLIIIGLLPAYLLARIFDVANIHPFPDVATNSIPEIASELILVASVALWGYFISCALLSIYDRRKNI